MRGHYAYYGISGNFRRLRWYAHKVARIWHQWLSRRGSRIPWTRFYDLLKRHPLPAARIAHRYTAVRAKLSREEPDAANCTSGPVRGGGGNILTYSDMPVASSARQKLHKKQTEFAAPPKTSALCHKQTTPLAPAGQFGPGGQRPRTALARAEYPMPPGRGRRSTSNRLHQRPPHPRGHCSNHLRDWRRARCLRKPEIIEISKRHRNLDRGAGICSQFPRSRKDWPAHRVSTRPCPELPA